MVARNDDFSKKVFNKYFEELDPDTWRALDPGAETLIDIDVPADLEALGPADRL